jgi:hypothetical protein
MGNDNSKKTIFTMSEDELMHNEEKRFKLGIEPVQKAVEILDRALCSVLKKLGVDTEKDDDDIRLQQELLGIVITEVPQDFAPGEEGFFVFRTVKSELTPYAYVGGARIDSLGICYCDIHWFDEERLDEVGGDKIFKQ